MKNKFFIRYQIKTGLGSKIETEWWPTKKDVQEREFLLSRFGHRVLEMGCNNIGNSKES